MCLRLNAKTGRAGFYRRKRGLIKRGLRSVYRIALLLFIGDAYVGGDAARS